MADIYYNDAKQPIATTISELLIYFKSIQGTTVALNIPYVLDCPMPALLQITSSGNLPGFIYKNGLSQANKIFLNQLPASNFNLASLCNGVNNENIVPPPDVDTPWSETIVVPVPVLGTPQGNSIFASVVSVTGKNGWIAIATEQSGSTSSGIVILNIAVQNPIYNSTGAPDTFINEFICQISADGVPQNDVNFTSADNANMPAGSQMIIQGLTGKVFYSGNPTHEDGTGSTIEIFNLQYNING